MKDRFKFRYYDEKTKKIYDVVYIDFDLPSASLRVFDGCLLHIGVRDFKFENLIRCTGLKDKNGKLVYFDDLVKNEWGEICRVVMQTDDIDYGQIVLTAIKVKNEEWLDDCIYIPGCIEESEVIGNIYENPELLE